MMKIHGQWEISLVRNVVLSAVAGIFNEEGVEAELRDFHALIPKEGAWAALIDLSNWDMGSSATFKAVVSFHEWIFAHGCQRIAIVMPESFRRTLHQKNTSQFSADVFRYFCNFEAASVWLSGEGFLIAADENPHQAFLQRTRFE
jgi:anti-anti-sigma regulatory factor